MRFCVGRNLKLQEIIELCKELLVEIASGQLSQSEREASISRLSLMTGVHRKDVADLRVKGNGRSESADIVSRVIGHWRESKKYSARSGRPRALTCEGSESEFARLVWAVSQEINPYTILFELERIGAVKRSKGRVNLLAQIYIPKEDVQSSMMLLEDDYNDLIVAVDENVFGRNKVPNLHIKTEYTNVPTKNLATIRKWFLQEGSRFHVKARKFLSRYDKDVSPGRNKDEPSARVAIVAYSRIEEN